MAIEFISDALPPGMKCLGLQAPGPLQASIWRVVSSAWLRFQIQGTLHGFTSENVKFNIRNRNFISQLSQHDDFSSHKDGISASEIGDFDQQNGDLNDVINKDWNPTSRDTD